MPSITYNNSKDEQKRKYNNKYFLFCRWLSNWYAVYCDIVDSWRNFVLPSICCNMTSSAPNILVYHNLMEKNRIKLCQNMNWFERNEFLIDFHYKRLIEYSRQHPIDIENDSIAQINFVSMSHFHTKWKLETFKLIRLTIDNHWIQRPRTYLIIFNNNKTRRKKRKFRLKDIGSSDRK